MPGQPDLTSEKYGLPVTNFGRCGAPLESTGDLVESTSGSLLRTAFPPLRVA
jgi:hypothetical protein